MEHHDKFQVAFSEGQPAGMKPLKIDLKTDARPIWVKLRNYSKKQRYFFSKFTEALIHCGMTYPIPTSTCSSAPLVVRKPGPAKFRFTVDLRPVNNFTLKKQYPMPNLENELAKIHKAYFFATFDLSHV